MFSIREMIRRRRNLNNTIKTLSGLSDRDLQDIGLHRGDIESIARSVIDVHRTVRDSSERTTDVDNTNKSNK